MSWFHGLNKVIGETYTAPVCKMGPTVVESSEVVCRKLQLAMSSHPWPVTHVTHVSVEKVPFLDHCAVLELPLTLSLKLDRNPLVLKAAQLFHLC